MRTFSVLAIAAALTFPGVASAGDYAKSGVIEVGGEVEISSGSTTIKPEGGGEATIKSTDITLAPQVGYFLMDNLELLGQLSITSSSSDDETVKETSTGFGLAVGAAYLLPMGGLYVGPQAMLGFANNSTKQEAGGNSLEFTLSGPVIDIGGVAKVPFGGGGVLGVGLGITYAPLSLGGDAKGDATVTDFGLSTSFTVFW